MNQKLKAKILESLSSVLPITGIVLIISIFLVSMEIGTLILFLSGAVMLVVGMGFFQLGAEMSMSPLGEGIGIQISKSKHILPVILISFLMGTIITIAEPDLQVLAGQVPAIPNSVLIWTVAVGVGLFLTVAVLRILMKVDLSAILIGLYIVLIALSFIVPKDFLAVAFDAGGVTTGPVTVPFIMTIGAGLVSLRGDRHAADDSFGLVALSSIGPVLAVLILGCFYNPQETMYSATEIATVVTTQDVFRAFTREIPLYGKEVGLSIIPIFVMFLLFQLFSHRYNRRQRFRITIGFVYTYIGLVLFLCGVNIGFAPVGALLGREIAAGKWNWVLIPIGMLIGYYIVKAEPAIHILNRQIRDVTNGAISEKAMNRCMSIGVSVSVGLSMLRVLTGISIHWILIPGYIAALVLTHFVPKIFVGIAFDSGGVASGPMTSTFLLPLSIGACEMVGGNIMTDAFGIVALVALTPLIAVQIMGVQYQLKQNKMKKSASGNKNTDFSNEIVDYEEEYK
ncbi:MAG: DUF1538 domain-containing protein [Oscillospiraceae bacterium]